MNAVNSALGTFFGHLKKKRIIEILAAFIGGGWLLLEFVHWILVDHYHFPEKAIDITFVTILGALAVTLVWRWFSGREGTRKFKPELILIPLVLLVTVLLDVNLLLHLKGSKEEIAPAPEWQNSIAVLPFDNISPEEGQDYFCDGLTDELITRLSKIKDLKVIAKTSAFSFKGREIDIREIGHQLDVATVLEGAVRKAGNRLRITAQLINVADGFHLWSESYDKELTDIFSIQDEIALKITDRLKLATLGGERTKLVKRPTGDLQAYNLYLQGRYFWDKRTADDLRKAISFFDQAIAKDPRYALAYVGLADCYLVLNTYGRSPSKETLPKAKRAVSRALEIDDTLAEAHTSLAYINEIEGAASEAQREYERAIELNPNYPTARLWYSGFLSDRGRLDEAEPEVVRAKELDPLSLIINAFWGCMPYFRKDYDQAIRQLSTALEFDPDFGEARRYRGKCYLQKGMFEEAIADLDRAREDFGDNPYGLGDLGYAYAYSGEKVRATQILNDLLGLSEQGYSLNFDIAFVYCGLGEKDKAFSCLENAYREREPMMDFKVDPAWDGLRSDPRYKALLKKMGLD